MLKRSIAVLIPLAVASILVLTNRHETVQAKGQAGAGFASIPGTVGGQDMFGPYDIVKGWPKDISTIPGNEKWTWGAGQSVYAENPNRVFMLFRGELPNIPRPRAKLLPEFGTDEVVLHGWRAAGNSMEVSLDRIACQALECGLPPKDARSPV